MCVWRRVCLAWWDSRTRCRYRVSLFRAAADITDSPESLQTYDQEGVAWLH